MVSPSLANLDGEVGAESPVQHVPCKPAVCYQSDPQDSLKHCTTDRIATSSCFRCSILTPQRAVFYLRFADNQTLLLCILVSGTNTQHTAMDKFFTFFSASKKFIYRFRVNS